MGRPERPLDPEAGPLQRFASELRELRVKAGRPSYRELSRRAHFSVTALSEAAGGMVLPSLPVVRAYVTACAGDPEEWAVRWREVAGELAPDPPDVPPDVSSAPYPGLRALDVTDADRLFGRRTVLRQLTGRVRERHFVAVFGPSGTGKSSLLRAGLIPALESSGESWPTILCTPGPRPLEELALRLAIAAGVSAAVVHRTLDAAEPDGIRLVARQVTAAADPAARLLLVVDQFEELFTLCSEERERTRFVDVLVALAAVDDVHVVLGVRADFYARCAGHPALVRAFDDHQMLVGPMSEDELREAVTGPAKWAGLGVEQALVEAVVAEAGHQPGALPMVSHALHQTWCRRTGTTLTLGAYRAAGGVSGAVARTAEDVYEKCTPEQRAALRRIFLRLTAFGDGTEDTRRRATPAELADGDDAAAAHAVLDRLIQARLITADHDSVTVGHEALIRQWPRLVGWLTEDREFLREHRRLSEATAEWDGNGHDNAYLFRGARLAAWEERPRDQLNEAEREFLAASHRREEFVRSRARKRNQLTIAGLAGALTIISVLAMSAMMQAGRLATERDVALSRQLGVQARSQLALDPEAAARLAVEAYRTHPTAEAEAVLRQSVVEQHPVAAVPERRGRLLGIVFSPDGRSVATSGEDGTIHVRPWPFDAARTTARVLRGPVAEAWDPHFSPDGRRLAAAGRDGVVRVWDLSRPAGPVQLDAKAGPILSIDISPDGTLLACAYEDGTVRLWNFSTGRPGTVLRGHDGKAVGVAFSPDGRRLASSGHDRTVRLWNLDTRGEPLVLRGHQAEAKFLDFAPDGRWLASAGLDGTARVWPVAGPGGEPVVLQGHQGTVEDVMFSPDGRRVATTSDDRTVRVWNRDGSGTPLVMAGNAGTVWAVAFSPDGARLLSVGDDGTVRAWDPRGPGEPTVLRGHVNEVWTASFTPDGRHILSGGADGTVRMWPAEGDGRPVVLAGHQDDVLGASFSAGGNRVVSASFDGTVRLWDMNRRKAPTVLRDGPHHSWHAVFLADNRVAAAGQDGGLRIWPADGRGAPTVRRAGREYMRDVAAGPDGRSVATAGEDGAVRVWDTTSQAPPVTLRGHEGLAWSVAFLPDGDRLVSVGRDATVRIWSLSRPWAAPIVQRGHQGFVWSVSASPDGRWIATAGKDGTVRIWPTDHAGQSVTYSGFGSPVSTVAFAPDSRGLVTSHEDGTIRVWDCVACRPTAEILGLAEALS